MAVGVRAFAREQLSANAARLGDEVVACHDLADREGARGGLHVRVVPFQPECSKAGENLSASSCSSTCRNTSESFADSISPTIDSAITRNVKG